MQTQIEVIVGLLIAISIASERLVEITKGLVPKLQVPFDNPRFECWRRTVLQVLAVVAGIATAFASLPVLRLHMPQGLTDEVAVLCIGLLASGGSGLWNSILGYLLEVKKIKAEQAKSARVAVAQGVAVLPGETRK